MNPDSITTTTGATTAIAGAGAGALLTAQQIDPAALAALLPPPYNLYVMLGLIGIGAISHLVQTYYTNKHQVTVSTDMQQTTPGVKA